MIDWGALYSKIVTERSSSCGENHHIIPKHAGGRDSDGLVMLKRGDHILAHYIRWRWKGEVGDRIAYTMMLGQVINPMLDIESRAYIMMKIFEYSNDPIYIKKKRDEAIDRWNGVSYIVESGGEFVEYDNQYQLQSAYGVSKITIKKYVDTNIIIDRGALKGSRIFTKKD